MGKFSRLGNELYQGRKSYDFVGHRALWYTISGTLVAVAILVIIVKGLNFGIEFTGGTQYRIDNLTSDVAGQGTADELRDEIGQSGLSGEAEPTATTPAADRIIIQMEDVTAAQDRQVRQIISDVTGGDPADENISQDEI